MFFGRLTPLPGSTEFSGDALAQSTLAYSPIDGYTLPISDGSSLRGMPFLSGPTDQIGANIVLTGIQSLTANTVHDVFAYNDNGSVKLGLIAWAAGVPTSTTGFYGIGVNSSAVTLQTAAGPVSIDPKRATWLGTILIGSVDATITCKQSYGFGTWGVFNGYRKREINLMIGDATDHPESQDWPSWQAPFLNGATKAIIVTGRPTKVSVHYRQNGHDDGTLLNSVGWNSDSAPDADAYQTEGPDSAAILVKADALGLNSIYPLCKTVGAVCVDTGMPNMQMAISWQA